MASRYEELLDYRRAVAGLYAAVRESMLEPGSRRALDETCRRFREGRDHLFRTHPQSALSPERRSDFSGLRYFDYEPAYRFVLPVDTGVEPLLVEAELGDDGLIRLQRFGRVHLTLAGQSLSLSLYWVMGYGGVIFLPFRDLTNNRKTYGGGRYVLDAIKHADLGQQDGRLVIGFNYAYNPSCAYDERWVCPLAPLKNRLGVRVEAGETIGKRLPEPRATVQWRLYIATNNHQFPAIWIWNMLCLPSQRPSKNRRSSYDGSCYRSDL